MSYLLALRECAVCSTVVHWVATDGVALMCTHSAWPGTVQQGSRVNGGKGALVGAGVGPLVGVATTAASGQG